jgi:hypothetical protein
MGCGWGGGVDVVLGEGAGLRGSGGAADDERVGGDGYGDVARMWDGSLPVCGVELLGLVRVRLDDISALEWCCLGSRHVVWVGAGCMVAWLVKARFLGIDGLVGVVYALLLGVFGGLGDITG